MNRIKVLLSTAVLLFVAASGSAFASHASIGTGVGHAGPVTTVSAATLPKGSFNIEALAEYQKFDTFSDAELIGFAESGREGIHNVEYLFIPSIGIAYGLQDCPGNQPASLTAEDGLMMNRREFILAATGMALSGSVFAGVDTLQQSEKIQKSKVSLVKTSDRASGIQKAIGILGINPVKGKDVLLKPNFNTSDPFPGSTHNDTLVNLILRLKDMGAKSITVSERSGQPDTSDVLAEKGIYDICKKLDVKLINFEDLPDNAWVRIKPEQSHWNKGFDVAGPVLDSECVVTTCCLKTHGYGGVFTMSLKLSVGIAHKRNMTELHSSIRSMRKMIAEINQAYKPSLILMDAIEAFVDGGPMTGVRKKADVILAGTDRIAIDAVGLSILKELGSNKAVMGKKIFEQEQIARAVELGLGVTRPEDIEIVTGDEAGKKYSERLKEILSEG
ncbi:MAG: DUF362 domain-containing protein [Nitrospirae bacterium]|nr:DUF362 domain-containing protein [Nitrospirota bacterium]